jgi:hypothetical protein
LMRIWSKRDLSDAKGPEERAPRGLTQEGWNQPPGRFIWHDVGVLAT